MRNARRIFLTGLVLVGTMLLAGCTSSDTTVSPSSDTESASAEEISVTDEVSVIEEESESDWSTGDLISLDVMGEIKSINEDGTCTLEVVADYGAYKITEDGEYVEDDGNFIVEVGDEVILIGLEESELENLKDGVYGSALYVSFINSDFHINEDGVYELYPYMITNLYEENGVTEMYLLTLACEVAEMSEDGSVELTVLEDGSISRGDELSLEVSAGDTVYMTGAEEDDLDGIESIAVGDQIIVTFAPDLENETEDGSLEIIPLRITAYE